MANTGMVLGRKDVAGRPAHIGTKRGQRFDEHGGLDGHVQRTGDARALERLRRTEFGAQRHQAGHFGFRDLDLAATKVGKADIGDDIIMGSSAGGHGGLSCFEISSHRHRRVQPRRQV
jgi:hypothetical protein